MSQANAMQLLSSESGQQADAALKHKKEEVAKAEQAIGWTDKILKAAKMHGASVMQPADATVAA